MRTYYFYHPALSSVRHAERKLQSWFPTIHQTTFPETPGNTENVRSAVRRTVSNQA